MVTPEHTLNRLERSKKMDMSDKVTQAINEHGARFDSKTSDLTPKAVSDWVTEKVIDLGPDFQRRDRWDNPRRSKLIESILLGIPIPPVYLSSEPNQAYSVIDGKQRITAIHKFIQNDLTLTNLEFLKVVNGLKFEDLPFSVKSKLKVESAIRAVIIIPGGGQIDKNAHNKNSKYEVFHRLNTGGIKLEPQEIRNSTFRGPFNDLLQDLAKDPYIQSQLKVRPQDEAYKKMGDIENVLRFFTLLDRWKTASGFKQLKDELDSFIADNQHPSQRQLETFRRTYISMRDRAEKLLGDYAFRRWTPSSETWRDQQNIAVYDAQSIALAELSDADFEKLVNHKEAIIDSLKKIFTENEIFISSIQGTTGSKKSIQERVQVMKSTFSEHL